MPWKHNFKHIDVSDALIQYAEEVFHRGEKFLQKDSSYQIFYSKEKHAQCRIDVIVQNGIGRFHATAHDTDFYTAVDDVAAKLSRQFHRKKEKLQRHKDFSRSREGRLERLNSRLEYDNSPYPTKKPA